MAFSHRDIVRHYADNLRNGTTDPDLTPRQRRIAAVILATASNDARATVHYPADTETRNRIALAMGATLWHGNAMALMQAIGPSAASDYETALDRAATILRNV